MRERNTLQRALQGTLFAICVAGIGLFGAEIYAWAAQQGQLEGQPESA